MSPPISPSTPPGQIAPFTSMQGTITALTGLQPGSTYHYRLTATNPDGTSYGPDETFTTPAYSNPIVQPPGLPLLQNWIPA